MSRARVSSTSGLHTDRSLSRVEVFDVVFCGSSISHYLRTARTHTWGRPAPSPFLAFTGRVKVLHSAQVQFAFRQGVVRLYAQCFNDSLSSTMTLFIASNWYYVNISYHLFPFYVTFVFVLYIVLPPFPHFCWISSQTFLDPWKTCYTDIIIIS